MLLPWPPPREPRPPTTVMVTVGLMLLAAAITVVAVAGLWVAGRWRGTTPPTGLAYLVFLALSLSWASWRRQGVAWGGVIAVGGACLAFGAAFAVVGLASKPSVGGAILYAAIFLTPVVVAAAWLRRPVRAWFGFACHACGAFRWRMNSLATQAPCRRCGAPYGTNP